MFLVFEYLLEDQIYQARGSPNEFYFIIQLFVITFARFTREINFIVREIFEIIWNVM